MKLIKQVLQLSSCFIWHLLLIKTHGSESQGQKEAAFRLMAYACLQAYVTTALSYLHAWQL